MEQPKKKSKVDVYTWWILWNICTLYNSYTAPGLKLCSINMLCIHGTTLTHSIVTRYNVNRYCSNPNPNPYPLPNDYLIHIVHRKSYSICGGRLPRGSLLSNFTQQPHPFILLISDSWNFENKIGFDTTHLEPRWVGQPWTWRNSLVCSCLSLCIAMKSYQLVSQRGMSPPLVTPWWYTHN